MFIKSKRILVTMTFGTHHVSTHEVSHMCNCTSCFCSMSSSIVMPAPVRPSVKRGALLRAVSGEKVGDLYMLVREATGVFAKDAEESLQPRQPDERREDSCVSAPAQAGLGT